MQVQCLLRIFNIHQLFCNPPASNEAFVCCSFACKSCLSFTFLFSCNKMYLYFHFDSWDSCLSLEKFSHPKFIKIHLILHFWFNYLILIHHLSQISIKIRSMWKTTPIFFPDQLKYIKISSFSCMCFSYKSVPHGNYYNTVIRATSWKGYPPVAISFYCWPYFKLFFFKAFLLYFPLGKNWKLSNSHLILIVYQVLFCQ